MSNEVKYMDIKEFQDKGYLQELNRQFLHPLGLALEVAVDDDGNVSLGGIWDYREDPEGIYFDLENSSDQRIERFMDRAQFIANEFEKRRKNRKKLFNSIGYVVEPIYKGIKG